MSRLSLFSWLSSGFVHALAFALLGTLLTQVVAERPDFFVPRGTINATFSPPPRAVAVKVERPLPEDTVEPPLPQPAAVEEELPVVEEEPEQVTEVEPAPVEPPPVDETPLPPSELLAMSELATRPPELPRQPRSSTRRRPAAPPAVARTPTETRRPPAARTPVSQVTVEKTIEREPEPQLKTVDASPARRQVREIDTPPVKIAEESQNAAQQQQVAGSTESRPLRPVSNVPPVYPRDAIRRRLEGTVKLRVQVGVNGQVLSVVVAQSSGHAMLDESALTAIRSWKFSPMMRDGKAAASSALIPVRFHLD